VFKNARLYKLDETAQIDLQGLDELLAQRLFRPCGPVEVASLGWHPPMSESAEGLSHAAGGCVLLSARRQERILPSSVVAEALEERVADLEARESRDVGRAERRRLREEVVIDLLPRAFTRSRQIHAYLDTVTGWLVVDAASEKASDELVGLLRESLGTLPVRPPRPPRSPVELMTSWVSDRESPEGLSLGDECELRDARDERSVVRCRGQDLAGEEISTHLQSGKQVVKLGLDWQDRLNFLLQEDLSLKRLRFADELVEEVQDVEDEAARLDAEFAIMSLELRALIARLDELFEMSRGA
jgi:recombination associated protein RdgC